MLLSVAFVTVVLCCGCTQGVGGGQTAAVGDTLQLRYAERLTIVRYAGYTTVALADPWNEGKTLHRYVLLADEQDVPAEECGSTVIHVPLKRCVVTTSVHCSLVESLGCGDCIGGVCDLQYIHLPFIEAGCRSGRVVDCGSSLSPMVEKIIDMDADALFLSPFQNSGGYGRLEELDIPIIETADYMETSPLGRAEWMRFYGLLFGAEDEADSLFADVEQRYLALKHMAEGRAAERAATVVMDKMTGGVWYVPGGRSTVGRLIADAGIAYPWMDDEHSGSLALPFERVLESAESADMWLFRYNAPGAMTRGMLLSENEGYAQFNAFRTGRLYGCNTATSNFYEETPFHPDRLLRDFITIAHPDLGLGEPRYFLKIEGD